MSTFAHLQVAPEAKVSLRHLDPADTGEFRKEGNTARLAEEVNRLRRSQALLYADASRAVLIVLQAMDAGGKDGTIRHVFSGLNPLGTTVSSFKVPTAEEAAHDFLWRVHRRTPRLGEIGIFNRSHYEDVLVARVHGLAPPEVIEQRYSQINQFESLLTASGVVIRKFFLHISADEQARRLKAREDDPAKRWKLSPSDKKERRFWAEYQTAYETALSRTSTAHAPWFIIPADSKWFRNLAVSTILADSIDSLRLKYPEPVASKKEKVPA